MELRHFRYFVAVAEEGSVLAAARRLRVAQPALSKQIHDLESEVGVTLFKRLPRGVRLTPAGEAFLHDARATLANADKAVSTARRVRDDASPTLNFGNGGEMGVFSAVVANLLAAFRQAKPETAIRLLYHDQMEQRVALRERAIDIAACFVTRWPVDGFAGHRILDTSITGVMLPANHPLSAQTSVRLAELRDLTLLHSSSTHWPETFRDIETGLRTRGLVLPTHRSRPLTTLSGAMQIAAGDSWSLGNEMTAKAFSGTTSIVFRRFVDAPIQTWLALLWLPNTSPIVENFVDVARGTMPWRDSTEKSA